MDPSGEGSRDQRRGLQPIPVTLTEGASNTPPPGPRGKWGGEGGEQT